MSYGKVKVPSDLNELLKEALINNTYDISCVENSLTKGLENSFAFLYRVQRNKVPYTYFHFETKERNLKYNLNEILEKIEENKEKLKNIDLESHPELEDECRRIKEELRYFTSVDFGDFYINDNDEVCIRIDHDMIQPEKRGLYIRSKFFGKELTLKDVYSRPDIFVYYPLLIVDDELILDIKIRMDNGNTTFVLPSVTDSFVMKKDLTFSYHETHVMFIENCFSESVTLTNVQLRYYDSGKLNKFPKSKFSNLNKLEKNHGLFFANIITDSGKRAFPLQFVDEDDEYFYIDYSKDVFEFVRSQNEVTFLFTFFKDLYKHDMYHGHDISNKLVDGKVQSELILLENSPGVPFSMPIPEVNCIVMKEKNDLSEYNEFSLSKTVNLKMYYPNIYQITDSRGTSSSKYRLFYFYKSNKDFNYTPIHDFYYKYLFYLCNENYPTLESLINAVYEDRYNESADNEAFRNLFKYLLDYRDYRFAYDVIDFVNRHEWTKYPETYKVRKMKEFVQADHKILADYVMEQKSVGNVYHMFVKNVSLPKRIRRTTRFESKEVIPLYDSVTILDDYIDGALFVVNDVTTDYDYKTMVRLSDVSFMNPNVKIGDYVLLENDRSSFVFALKADDHMSKELTLRIYVDGKIETGTFYKTELDIQYIYIPEKHIKPDSYIMIEEYYDTALTEVRRFDTLDDWHEFHVVNGSKFMVPTMNDVYVKFNDVVLPKEDYEVIPIYHGSEYKTTDDEGNEITKFANVSTFKIRLLNPKYLSEDLYIRIKKKSYVKHMNIERISYPRFYLNGLFDRIEMNNIRVYKNGILIPPNMYELQSVIGLIRLQLKTKFDPGDILTLDVTPFYYKHVYHLKDLSEGTVINLKGIINKPIRLNYYDFYSNGKRIGLPHVFYVGAYGVTLANLKSLHNFDIYEKERDWEYFGYEQLNEDGTYHNYYYDITDFVNEPFIEKDVINKILKEIIDNQKDPDVDIKPNVDEENPELFDNYHPLEEDLRIFYYEEYIPLKFVNPDEVQFNKDYFVNFYPNMAKTFLVDESGIGSENGDVIFTNPDINTEDLSREYAVMLTGENDLDEYDIIE